MNIRYCPLCGDPMEMTRENITECEAICEADYGLPMGYPGLVMVCEDCYEKDDDSGLMPCEDDCYDEDDEDQD